MTPDQLLKIKRHLIGLLKAVEEDVTIKDDTIHVKTPSGHVDVFYYDNRGRLVDVAIKIDKLK